MLVDTHCHLYDEVFNTDSAAFMDRSVAAGVDTVLLPNINTASHSAMMAVAAKFPKLHVKPMIGLHPCYVKEHWQEELDQLKSHYLANPGAYCAVGEIGLDLYWDTTTLDIQIQALEQQLEWAKKWDLPVAVHVRSAWKELFPVLENAQDGRLRGVLHCFSGGKKQVNRALKMGGFYFGLGGVVTYNRSATDTVVAHIPTDKILLETDAPYLAPQGKKGQKNEPSFMVEAARVVAEVKGLSLEEVGAITTANAKTLFRF